MATEALQPHDRINFNLRPNKRIERRLVAESLACIYRYDNPRRFGYVGMGSYYFSDFTLFHRVFGIGCMVSIERDEDNCERFDFNKPFDCIQMKYGETSDVLPTLDIFDKAPVICWLDYYDRINDCILGDIRTVLTKAQLGSVLIVTLNASGFRKTEDISTFIKHLPKEKSATIDRKKLASVKGICETQLSLIEMTIQSTLSDLKASQPGPVHAERILNISYRDGVPMVTFGWLLLDDDRLARLNENPNALDAPGICKSVEPLDIATPVLTFREISHLRTILPNGIKNTDFEKNAAPIRKEDAQQFAQFYRYFPSFADVEE